MDNAIVTPEDLSPAHTKTITTSLGRHTFVVLPHASVPSPDEMQDRANAIDDLILRLHAPLFERKAKQS